MPKTFMLLFVLLIIFIAGCGGDSTVSVIPTPTIIQPTVQPTGIPTAGSVISTLNEIEAKRITISAKDGGSVEEGDLEIEIPGNALEENSSVEIARVTINEQNASGKDDNITAYEISTGGKDEERELKEPARVIFKNADPNVVPVLYNGKSWFPIDDYEYDSNSRELSIWINFIEEDSNEYIEAGDDKGEIEAPVVVGVNYKRNYRYNVISQKDRFKIFYDNEDDKDYANTIASVLDGAYDYYKGLGYKPPVKSLVNRGKSTSNYIYTYIYTKADPDYGKSAGVAWTDGYMGFNKDLVDINQGGYEDTLYHELLHLTQYNYSNNRDRYESWFSESMCTAMEYYAVNRPFELYDIKKGRWNMDLLRDETFNQKASLQTQNYNKYIIWSYFMGKSDAGLFHNIMSTLPAKDHQDPELFNNAFLKRFGKNFPSLMNELIEDYYINGKFFNKSHFYKLSERSENQPYDEIIQRDGTAPGSSVSQDYTIKPLTAKSICYSSGKYKGTFEVDFHNVSSNCKIKIYSLRNYIATYEIGNVEEITNDTVKKYTLGDNITDVFILMENTSMNSDASVSIFSSKL